MLSDYKSDFTEQFRYLLGEASGSFYFRNMKEDAHCQKIDEEYDNVFDEIRNILGEKEHMMFRLEELTNEITGIGIECGYYQGFIDCVSLLKMLHVI